VIVKDGEVVGHGFHIYARKEARGDRCLEEAGERALDDGLCDFGTVLVRRPHTAVRDAL